MSLISPLGARSITLSRAASHHPRVAPGLCRMRLAAEHSTRLRWTGSPALPCLGGPSPRDASPNSISSGAVADKSLSAPSHARAGYPGRTADAPSASMTSFHHLRIRAYPDCSVHAAHPNVSGRVAVGLFAFRGDPLTRRGKNVPCTRTYPKTSFSSKRMHAKWR